MLLDYIVDELGKGSPPLSAGKAHPAHTATIRDGSMWIVFGLETVVKQLSFRTEDSMHLFHSQ